MTIKERTPLPAKDLSFQGSEIRLHIFAGQDKEGNPKEERYSVVCQGAMESLINSLAEKIEASGFKPDIVVTLVRGGMVPSRKISDRLGDLPSVCIAVGSKYNPDGTRIPPLVYQELPNKEELENTLRILGKLAPNKGIETVLMVDEVIDNGDSEAVAESQIEQKWHITHESGNLKIAAVSAKDKGLAHSHVDYYVFHTNDWIIHDWEKFETFVALFATWKAYKSPLPDEEIKERFRELGYSETDIVSFGKNLFKEELTQAGLKLPA